MAAKDEALRMRPEPALHLRDHRLAHQERALEVGVEVGVPDLLGELLDAGAAGDAGIVDEDVDAAEGLLDRLGDGAAILGLADVGRDLQAGPALVAPIRLATSSSSSWRISVTTTVTPSPARVRAISRPMPRPAPVTMATLPLRSISISDVPAAGRS